MATPSLNEYCPHQSLSLTPASIPKSTNRRTPSSEQSHGRGPDTVAEQSGSNGESPAQQRELWQRTVTSARGRAPGDPLAQKVTFQCQNLEDLESCLRDYLSSPNPAFPTEHTTVDLVFPISAAFLVVHPFKPLPQGHQGGTPLTPGSGSLPPLYGAASRTVISVMDAMTLMPDPKDNMRKQRVIARACSEAVARADGYRYSFHNNWRSKEDEANRFSYFCNDSVLNKGRAASGGAGVKGKKVSKPVYDCKGIIAVKFSAVKQNLEVQYKHIPLHKTYEERAPPPRNGSKRRKLMELYNQESLPQPHGRPKSTTPKVDDSAKPKRKRQTKDPQDAIIIDEDLNLGSIESLLGMDSLDVDHSEAGPDSTQRPKWKYKKKPKCTMCQSKKAKCNGEHPCNGCAERPTFCIYEESNEENTNDNIRAPGLGTEQAPSTGPGTVAESVQTTPALAPLASKRRRKAKAAATVEPSRDVQKELGDAMSEFDKLRAQLAEAEERIKRLEQEKHAAAAVCQPAWEVVLPTDYPGMRQKKTKG